MQWGTQYAVGMQYTVGMQYAVGVTAKSSTHTVVGTITFSAKGQTPHSGGCSTQ